MKTAQLPPMIWQAIATIVIFALSAVFGADQVGGVIMLILSGATAALKLWQVQQPGDSGAVATRGMVEPSSKMRRFWLE